MGDANRSSLGVLRPRTRAEMRDRARREKEAGGNAAELATGALVAHIFVPHLWLLKAFAGPDKSVEQRWDFASVSGLVLIGALIGLGIGAAVGDGDQLSGALIGAGVTLALGVWGLIWQRGYDREATAYHLAFCLYTNRCEAELARARATGEIPDERTGSVLHPLRGRTTRVAEAAHLREWASRTGERPPSRPKRLEKHQCGPLGCYTRDAP